MKHKIIVISILTGNLDEFTFTQDRITQFQYTFLSLIRVN
jgi:hypothetical protein